MRKGYVTGRTWQRAGLLGLATLVATAVFAAAGAMAQVPPVGASAEIRDAQGRLIANAELREGHGEVLITLIFATPPVLTGTHGFRIHEVGRCDPPGFSTAGNGFNPFNKKHGRQNPDGAQVGDLPNVNFVNGLTSYNTSAIGATLAPGPASLLGPNKTALIIYSGEDDQQTDPDGKAGDRIACGVINQVNAVAASPAPSVARPAASPVAAPPVVAAQPPAAQVQPAPAKPAASPVVVAPPVVARPAGSPTPFVGASPVAAVQAAVPTLASSTTSTQTSGGGLGTLPALLIAIVGVGLVGAGYLLRRRAQLLQR